MKLVIMGPPGAGKGTQADKLAEHFSIPHISTGDLFRQNISTGTELGKKTQTFLEQGELVPLELTMAMLKDRLAQSDTHNGFILDGFPRSVEQAVSLRELLQDSVRDTSNPAEGLDAIIAFSISDDAVVERMLLRGRADDREDIIRNRLRVYYDQTAPLINYYAEHILHIDAIGDEDDVFKRTICAITSYIGEDK